MSPIFAFEELLHFTEQQGVGAEFANFFFWTSVVLVVGSFARGLLFGASEG